MLLLGIDTGGTFTDFVLYNGKTLTVHKCLSTPHQPEQAILQGIAALGIDINQLSITHGSTVATNAVLENKGVKTAYITNYGLADTLTIGRQARPYLYDLQPQPCQPPVAANLCLETGGRIGSNGDIIEPLSDTELETLRERIRQLAPQAVAINLLFSFLDDSFEKRIEAALASDVFISRSSLILPQYKEYERGITTWLNAAVGPIVQRYLNRLSQQLPTTTLSIMQSSGGTIAADHAGAYAVHMLLSGPAGGLAGAKFIAASCHRQQLLTFDMGGTSTDVSLINGELKLTSEAKINNYPIAIPTVDVHTIGAGGGSIAWIDAGGMLQVGPESAGASPGPACYNLGGTRPTVTDANLALGRLLNSAFLGGDMALNNQKALDAITTISTRLQLSLEDTALGIIRIANEHMAQALRVISIQRGIDPRLFTLVSFGGAGGLHVCALADALGIKEAIAPIYAGVLSALGMLVSPHSRQLSKSIIGLVKALDSTHIESTFNTLQQTGITALQQESIHHDEIVTTKTIDVRYTGQSYTLNIPWRGIEHISDDFERTHHERYGHSLPLAIELVNVCVNIKGPTPEVKLSSTPEKSTTQQITHTNVYGVEEPVAVISRGNLTVDTLYQGPIIITETTSTIFVAPSWQCTKDAFGNVLLTRSNK